MKGDPMDEHQIDRAIGFAVLLIIAFYLLQMVVPLLMWAIAALVAWRVYLAYHKRR
jgi:hypothetical protein